jgi:phage-related protein
MSLSFAQLEQSEEYKHLKLLERVSLFDTVNVEFPALGVSATARVVNMVYDCLADRVKSVTLGSVRANIADTIANQSSAIEQTKKETKTQIQKAQEAATSWLTNGKGYAYFRKDDLGNIVDILFMDTQDPATAVNVMRVGQSGIGFSHNGVNGPYISAWTIDGKFNADWIMAGVIRGMMIESGIIKTTDGSLVIDLNAGTFSLLTENGNLFKISKKQTEDGKHFANLKFYDVQGNNLITLTEDETGTGGGVLVQNDSGTLSAQMQATNTSAGFRLLKNGETVAYLGLAADGTNTLKTTNIICEKINGQPV